MNPIITVENIGKSYQISHQNKPNYHTFKDDFTTVFKKPFGGGSVKSERETFWALKDVSFEVNKGEVFGIVGKNGSGKSTLLKILSRIVDPTTGSIHMHGRVASLLEVGTGFHPELTGRENIYFNGSMLGMSKSEIDNKFDAIVKFSEVEKFLDTPVKFYSSGMYVRLAFAVAAHLEPDILIIDEVLAVGDAAFQKKCMDKISSIAKEGKTILFVSHSMGSVNDLCDKALLLEKGKVKIIGGTQEVTEKYLENNASDPEAASLEADITIPQIKHGKAGVEFQVGNHTFTNFRLNGKPLTPRATIRSGSVITVDLDCINSGEPKDLLIGFGIRNAKRGDYPIFVHNKLEGSEYATASSTHVKVTLTVPKLAPGIYNLEVHLWLDNQMYIEGEKVGDFKILGIAPFRGGELITSFPSSILVNSDWTFEQQA